LFPSPLCAFRFRRPSYTFSFFFTPPPPPRDLPSSPTRRSSDLSVFRRTRRNRVGGKIGEMGVFIIERKRLLKALLKSLEEEQRPDRKSTRLNSSHVSISYAVFCLKKKKTRTAATKARNRQQSCT